MNSDTTSLYKVINISIIHLFRPSETKERAVSQSGQQIEYEEDKDMEKIMLGVAY